jgi:hypothetical protein
MRGSPPATTVSWRGVMRWVEAFALDTTSREPFSQELLIELRVTGLPRQNIVLNDAFAIESKLAVVMAAHPGLGGTAIWGVGGEDPAIWDMLAAYRTGACALGNR